MANIKESIGYVLENEGGFALDHAGPTNFGVTIPPLALHRKVSQESITEDDIRNLPVEEAIEIYKTQYWDTLNLDRIFDQRIATCIFDTGVNRGISVGAKYAQKTANSILHLELDLDGKIGDKSLNGINGCTRSFFIRNYEGLVWAAYSAIVERDPVKYGRHLKGWQRRAEKLLTLI